MTPDWWCVNSCTCTMGIMRPRTGTAASGMKKNHIKIYETLNVSKSEFYTYFPNLKLIICKRKKIYWPPTVIKITSWHRKWVRYPTKFSFSFFVFRQPKNVWIIAIANNTFIHNFPKQKSISYNQDFNQIKSARFCATSQLKAG